MGYPSGEIKVDRDFGMMYPKIVDLFGEGHTEMTSAAA